MLASEGVRPLLAGGESELLPLLLSLAVLIAVAKLMGGLSVKLGQPAVLGELMAGLLLGPTVLDVMGWPLMGENSLGDTIHALGQLGVLWLMFAAGLEIELGDLRQAGRPSILGGVLGVVFPLAGGWLVAQAYGYPLMQALFVGITLSATSVSISAQTLLELGHLRTLEGVALLGAAVIDDILVIVSLSVFIGIAAGSGGLAAIGLQVGQMIVVLAAVTALAVVLLPRWADWAQKVQASESLLALVLSAVLLLAWLTEYAGGVAAITGAFLAGIGLGRSHLREEVEHGLHRVAYAFFVPLFLVDIGLQADLTSLQPTTLAFAGVIVVLAAASKLVGSGLGALLGGFQPGPALRMGLGMISRGEVGLIVAGVGVTEGLLPPELFSVVVLMILATTLLAPLSLRWAFARKEGTDGSARGLGSA